mgnify:CR=1 FL=1
MTVHQSTRAQSAIEKASARFQAAVVSATEKEQKARLKRRSYVLQAFGKWLGTAPQAQTRPFLDLLSEAASVADRKRIADYLAGLPGADVEADEPAPGEAHRAGAARPSRQPQQATSES